MSVGRYISTAFWDDPWIQTLDPSEKFLYLYFLSNPLTNIAGVFEITIRRICFDTGFNEDTIKRILIRFANDRKAFYFKGYIVLPNAPKHQKWQTSEDTKKGLDRVIKDLPDAIRNSLFGFGYAYPDIPQGGHMGALGGHTDADHTLLNLTQPNLTQPTEESAAIASPARRSKKAPKERDPLRDALNDSFLAKIKVYARPQQENPNLHRLAAAIRAKALADGIPERDAAQGCVETFWRLHETGKEFWLAFTPSRMLSQLETIWAEYRKVGAANDTSWLEGRPA